MNNKGNLVYLEDYIRNIQLEKDVERSKRGITSLLKREFNITFEIVLTKNKTNQFFGMCVYPGMDEIYQLTMAMMQSGNPKAVDQLYAKNITKTIKYIEIDSLLLYDQNLKMTPAEIVAIMLHEVGHVVCSDYNVRKLKNMRMMITSDLVTKWGLRFSSIALLGPFAIVPWILAIPVSQLFAQQFNADVMNEKRADNFARKNGYGEELISALNKLIVNGHGSLVKKTEAECDKDIEISVHWAVSNIVELKHRKDRLSKALKVVELTTPSNHLKGIISKIKDGIFNGKTRGNAREEILLAEAFSFDKKTRPRAPKGAEVNGKVKKLMARDLDIYRAELERVNTVDDKVFLIERLYDLMDIAEYAKDMLEIDPRKVMQSRQTIESYIDALNTLIKDTNAKKIAQTRYGLFIKYPSDYEG